MSLMTPGGSECKWQPYSALLSAYLQDAKVSHGFISQFPSLCWKFAIAVVQTFSFSLVDIFS